jgi:PAS domain S-box-containing protein
MASLKMEFLKNRKDKNQEDLKSKNWIRDIFFKSPMITGFIAFILTLGFGLYLSLKDYRIEQSIEDKGVLQAAKAIEDRIQEVLATARSSVNILAYLVETERVSENFYEVGKSIIENTPIINQIQFLDSGTIVATYPLLGNETVIGYNIISDPYTKTEAINAIERKELFFAGPLMLRQGGEAIVGRLPLFSDDENKFTGFAAVLIDWVTFKELVFSSPQDSALEFTIDLFKVSPAEGKRVSLLESNFSGANGPVEEIKIDEGNWIIQVQLTNSQAWISILPMTGFRILSAILIGFLVFKFSQQPYILNKKVNETTLELQLSNQRFNLASQATSEVIWDWDLVTDLTLRSENFEKLLGYFPSEKTKQVGFWKSLMHPEDLEQVENNLNETFNGKEENWSQEFRIKKYNGEYIHVIDKGLIIRDNLGVPIRMIGSTQDITFRKKAEEEIANQKQRISNVIEGTNAGTWEWNIQTGETIYNEIWANIIGYKLAELEPVSIQTWQNYSHPDDFVESNSLLELHFSGKTANYEAECRMRHKNGNWIWVLDRGKVLSWTLEGKPLMMFGTHVDITEKKKREEEIKIANLRLQSANQELKSFASVASHDMKEPLRMISSFLVLLEKKYTPILDEKGIQYINFAVDGAKRLSVLIDDLMHYAKIGFDPELIDRIDLNSLIQEVITLKQNIINEKKALINLEPLPDVMGIKTPIKSVFLNLISNALKYQKIGRPLQITISSKNLGDRIRVTVEDNGIGIEKEYFEKIFGLFSRLHAKTEYAGVGLGLAICKKVINQHGGEIWLESKLGEGSKFHLTLTKYERPTH